MSATQQFYCDQDTDGGGWVLVGRGREGWTEKSTGQGNADDIATNPDGTDAFTPAQLSANTVTALLNDKPLSEALPQGIRFHRALTTSGSEWQDLYATRENNEKWSWTFSAKAIWRNLTVTDHRWYGDTVQNLGMSLGAISAANTTFYTANFEGMAAQGWKQGFAYGSGVYGKNDASSYIWSQSNGGSGIPTSNRRALPNSYTEKVKWRTSEQTGTGSNSELNAYVQAITQIGNTVFIGGDYAYVQNAQTGEKVNQKFLTGYDVNTGELVRAFMPTFNGQVKALEALPNGLLAVGGEFTQVNGQSANGLVLLNPATGEIDTTWGIQVENRLAGGSPVAVKSLDASNGYLYVAGSFTHSKGNANSNFVYARNALHIKLSDGSVDTSWTPAFNGSVNGINASDDGQAVYLAGYFDKLLSQNKDTYRLAALRADNADTVADWTWESTYKEDTRPNAGFQFDVQDTGNTVYAGGSEHLIAQYDRYTFERKSASTTLNGGDFQDLYRDGNTSYGACYCGNWIYEGSGSDHKKPWEKAHQQDYIRLVGAFERETGEYLDEFQPNLKGASGFGIWESFVDSTGVLWVGGDINNSEGQNGGSNRTVGFARFTPRDVTPPATPSGLSIENKDGKDVLTWAAVSEANVKYQIIRNNRVIATVSEPTYSVDHQSGANYFVRAIDASENYSASTVAVVAVEPEPVPSATPTEEASPEATDSASPSAEPSGSASAEPTAGPSETVSASAEATPEPVASAEPTSQTLISSGDTWSYRLADSKAGNAWNTLSALTTDWAEGASPLGWGSFGAGTAIDRGGSYPIAFYARKTIEVADPSQAKSLTISTYADDGIVVYVNGKEVTRSNITTSRLAYYSMADWWVDTAQAVKKPVIVEVPASSLVAGQNVVAVEVHGASRFSTNISFDLSATLNK